MKFVKWCLVPRVLPHGNDVFANEWFKIRRWDPPLTNPLKSPLSPPPPTYSKGVPRTCSIPGPLEDSVVKKNPTTSLSSDVIIFRDFTSSNFTLKNTDFTMYSCESQLASFPFLTNGNTHPCHFPRNDLGRTG